MTIRCHFFQTTCGHAGMHLANTRKQRPQKKNEERQKKELVGGGGGRNLPTYLPLGLAINKERREGRGQGGEQEGKINQESVGDSGNDAQPLRISQLWTISPSERLY